ncbi:MAG: hypothetical protein PVG36_07340, partial [Methyloceanibacter sp.]
MPVLRHFTPRELSSGLPRLQSAAVLALVLMSFVPQQAWAQQSLSIATFGGAYGRAQEIAVLEPYARKTGTVISTEGYG